ncbi:hypothetical protein [Nocardia cyriacigeorgica]|uniref:Uncharacterized protein n=1 Tax=Nocardia cyriacigeorgica TaxID=135487 RepID=A0A6P1D2W5_9NOCA|nr:hypothetical protein [Nocardia cyriacigeorgica]NEW44338.1 hypothetical protein [Nocardia cyriacigeorgica]
MRSRPTTGSPRGFLVGASVGALAVAAHGLAGGGYPSSAELALVLIAASVTGLVAGALPWRRGPVPVLGVLAAGQVAGHGALTGIYGHEHAPSTSAPLAGELLGGYLPSGGMLLAHLGATLVCAALIPVAERLYGAISAALRVLLAPPRTRVRQGSAPTFESVVRLPSFAPAGATGPRAPPLARPA